MHAVAERRVEGNLAIPASSGVNRFARSFVIEDAFGFHARPAALFAKTARDYDARVTVRGKGGPSVRGTDIIGLLTLGVRRGELLVVVAEGSDARDAVAAIERALSGGIRPAAQDTGHFPG